MSHDLQHSIGATTRADMASAVRRLGLYFIYRGQEARKHDNAKVELPFGQDELFQLGALLLRHVSGGRPEDRA